VYDHKALQDLVSEIEKKEDDEPLSFRKFFELSRGLIFLRRVLDRSLVIPMFETFVANYKRAYLEIKEDTNKEYSGGSVATYIPPLAKANPEWFSTSFCSTDD
jgi:glutaminase